MERVSRYTPPIADQLFLLTRVLDCPALLRLPAHAHVDWPTVVQILGEGGRMASHLLAPINAAGDMRPAALIDGRVMTSPGYAAAYRAFANGGWIGLDLPRDRGGQGLPRVVQNAFAEMVNGACVAFGMLPLMQRAAARLLLAHGTPEILEVFVPRLVSGEWAATICISESQAGSDVGRIATRATRGDDGRWRVTGGKIFITFGDQDFTPQIAHLLLARTPDAPPGTRGLSLFVVPSRRIGPDGTPGEANGVTVTRVEHKMGLKGSPTCVMSFDNSLAYPVGAPGAGMRCMFTMVNTMRLEVAMQGVAVAGAATARALAYAAERRQGGPAAEPPPPLASHPDVRSMLLEMRALTEGFRAVVLQTAALLDLAHGSEDEGERRRSLALAEWLLPVGKAAGSEAGFRVANLAVQVFGGHGYISDSGVEQYVRDARVMAIYEGANGIQAIDLVTRKLGGGGERLGLFVDRVMADLHCHRSACPSLADALEVAVADLRVASDWLVARLEKQPRDCEAGARAYLELVAVVTLGWMWLRMAGAAPGTSLADTKLATALFVGEQLLPVSSLLRQRVHAGARTLDALALEELCRYPE